MNDFKIDVPLSEILGNLNNKPIEINLNTNELPDGPVAVSVSICDCNDNCTESPPIDYTIDNTLSLPDTVNINSVIFNNGGFEILWETSNAADFNQYDLYHSLVNESEGFSKIFSSNDINKTTYFKSDANPLEFNYFYVIVSDSFNYSTRGSTYISSLDPKPNAINIDSVSYDHSSMNLDWKGSLDEDFWKYEIHYGINDSLNTIVLDSIFDRYENSYSISEFDPYISNYFQITVFDTLKQSTKGNFKSNQIQAIPESVFLDSIISIGNEITISWTAHQSSNFERYNLYRSFEDDMSDKEILFSSTNNLDTMYFSSDNTYDVTYFFKVSMVDVWGYEVFSNVESIEPNHITFINNYDYEGQSISGFYCIQNHLEQYKIISKSSIDIFLADINKYGENISFQPFNYNDTETPEKLLETENNDGYVLITNAVNNFQDTDFKLTKIDQNGSIIWESVFGFEIDGENQDYGLDNANDLILSNDGGFIITGQYHAQHPDILILEINNQGNLENKYTIATASPSQRVIESGKSILTFNDNYIVLGSISQSSANGPSNIWLSEYDVNLNDVGDTLWSKTWNLNTYDVPEKLIQKMDGSFAFAGYSLNNSGEIESSWIINTDNTGNELSSIILSGNYFIYDFFENLDGHYIVAGKKLISNSFQGWISCLDLQGNQIWESTYGNEDSALFQSVNPTTDKGYILTGESQSNGTNSILHVKTDPHGNID